MNKVKIYYKRKLIKVSLIENKILMINKKNIYAIMDAGYRPGGCWCGICELRTVKNGPCFFASHGTSKCPVRFGEYFKKLEGGL